MLHVCGRDALFTALGGSALEQLMAQWLGWTQSSGRWMCYAMLQRARDDSSSSISGVAGSCQPRPDRNCERRVETGAGSGLGLGVGESSSTQAVDTRPPPPPAWGKGRFTKVCVCVCPRVSVGARVCNRDDSVGAQAPTRVRRHSDRTSAMQVRSLMGGSFWCNRRHLTPHRHMHRPPPTAHHRSHTSTGRRVQCLAAQHSTAHRGGVRLVNCAMGRESGGSVWWGRQRARPGAKLVGAWR